MVRIADGLKPKYARILSNGRIRYFIEHGRNAELMSTKHARSLLEVARERLGATNQKYVPAFCQQPTIAATFSEQPKGKGSFHDNPIPMWRDEMKFPFKKILSPITLDDHSLTALDLAARVAQRDGASMILLTVVAMENLVGGPASLPLS